VLTGTAFGAIVGIVLLFGRHRPDAAASLEAPLPAPQTWTRLLPASSVDPGSVEAEFRSAILESAEDGAAPGKTNMLALQLQVLPSDCRVLEARVGGSCGESGAPLMQTEMVAVQSLDEPLQGFLKLEGSGGVELAQTSTGGESQPSEWTLVERAPEAIFAFECKPGDRLLLAGARSAPATCARLGTSYTLEVSMDRVQPPHLHLYGVHFLETHLSGGGAEAAVEEGELILDGHAQPFSSAKPSWISIRAEEPHQVALTVKELRSGSTHFAVHTDLASTAEGAGHELPTRLEKNQKISWLLIGLFAGSFLAACFQYLVKRRRR
jgi:hypothetical protein